MAPLSLTIQADESLGRASRKSLLGLPLELRNLIWQFTVIETSFWARVHEPECRFKPDGSERACMEPPPFSQGGVLWNASLSKWRWRGPCLCHKRRGLNLLLVNRQVNAEANRYFWGGNVFCFDQAHEVITTIGERVSAENKALIRHISIWSWMPWRVRGAHICQAGLFSKFWGTILECSNLRTLEIQPEQMKGYEKELQQLAKRLPRLKSLSLGYMAQYRARFETLPQGKYMDGDSLDWKKLVYVRTSMPLPFDNPDVFTEDNCNELFRNFTTNFCVHVDTAVKTKFLGIDLDAEEDWDPWGYNCQNINIVKDLTDLSRVRNVTLPTGREVRLFFYGLPPCSKTRIEMSRLREARLAALRAAGKLTPAEIERRCVVRQRRRERREVKEAEAQERMQTRRDTARRDRDRQVEQELLREQEEAEAAKQALVNVAMENLEIRKKERKRVRSPKNGIAVKS